MIRKHYYIADEQDAAIKRLAKITERTESAVLRRIINRQLKLSSGS
jgi:hypothetical protein